MSLDQWEVLLGRWSGPLADAGQVDLRKIESENVSQIDGHVTPAPHPEAVTPSDASQAARLHAAESLSGKPPVATAPAASTPWLDSVEQPAMACEFEVLLNHAQYPQGIERARDALRVVHSLEDQLSVYRPRSDFSNVNRWGHARDVGVSYDACRLLAVAQEVSRETGRAFDITAGALSEVWGFSRRQGRKPADPELAEALRLVDSSLVTIDQTALTVRLARGGVKLNPGGIGKGYALDCVANALVDTQVEDFLIHGGRSSVAARGDRLDSTASGGWWIALAHPLRWEEKLGRVRLRNRALGTSGAGKQFFHYQGVRYSHVIDPRTGWPAQGVLSASAICRSGALADALATAFMVMGPEQTRAFCATRPELAAILVSQEPGSSRLVIDRINLAEEDWHSEREL